MQQFQFDAIAFLLTIRIVVAEFRWLHDRNSGRGPRR